MRAKLFAFLTALFLAVSTAPAWAQDTKPRPYSAMVTDPSVLIAWLFLLGCWWLVSIGLTAAFGKRNYPPEVAAITCWLAVSGFIVCLFVFIFQHMLHKVFSGVVWGILVVVILLLLAAVFATRSNSNA